MQLPSSDRLETGRLGRIFDNTSECYKFFWFDALMTKVSEASPFAGTVSATFGELIDGMIAEAWYMVTEYHLNLGPRDTLESLVLYIRDSTGMRPTERREDILAYLEGCRDARVLRDRKTLSLNVPYRLQAPFLPDMRDGSGDWHVSKPELIARINSHPGLIYAFGEFRGLDTGITVSPEWFSYLSENREVIDGWLRFREIGYLQGRNPAVPGIAEKLSPPSERDLADVRRYWKALLSFRPMEEIYGHETLDAGDIAIDHFVPWSYVAHDELWNLSPTTKSMNSRKSNLLPDWDACFPSLARMEFSAYEAARDSDAVRAEFERCAKAHLNDPGVRGRLYRDGHDLTSFSNALEEVVRPVYDGARLSGFGDFVL